MAKAKAVRKAKKTAKTTTIPERIIKALGRRVRGATTDELAKLTASDGKSVSSACSRLAKQKTIRRIDGASGRGTEAVWQINN